MTPETYSALVANFAYHATVIMTEKAPYKGGLGLGFAGGPSVYAEIEITPAKDGWDQVWDQVKVNGKEAGNRCGGREAYAKIVAPVLAEAAKSIE